MVGTRRRQLAVVHSGGDQATLESACVSYLEAAFVFEPTEGNKERNGGRTVTAAEFGHVAHR